MQEHVTGAPFHMNSNAAAPSCAAMMPATPTAQSDYRIWVDDEARFDMRKPCPLHTTLHQHPLMEMDALWQLARKLMPFNKCRFIKPGATPTSAFKHFSKSQEGRELDDVFRNIDKPGSWIALYNVEKDPQYASLAWQALATVRHLVERQQAGMFAPQAFIFISTPPSLTPFHIDTENNFWMQIRGRKVINLWDANDRGVVSGLNVEKFILDGALDDVKLSEAVGAPILQQDCAAGEGVYFPSTTPHATSSSTDWAQPGEGLTISFAIVFYTDLTRRHARIHHINRLLRRVGVTPQFPGTSRLDSVKALLGGSLVEFNQKFRGIKPRLGF